MKLKKQEKNRLNTMDCEMCGKTAVAKAKIEGTQLVVCANCARHGTDVRPLPQAPPKKRANAIDQNPVKEELIEQVRPDIAKLLRQHREKLKLNHEQFAARLQIRASTYHHYESGAAVPDIATARKLEHEMKIPIVVHMKVATPVHADHDEHARGLTMGDFFKKKK